MVTFLIEITMKKWAQKVKNISKMYTDWLLTGRNVLQLFYGYLSMTYYLYIRNISLRFPRKFEVDDSESLENIWEMFLLYYMHSDVCSRLKYSTTSCSATHSEVVKIVESALHHHKFVSKCAYFNIYLVFTWYIWPNSNKILN